MAATFRCANCGQEKPISQQGSVALVAQVALFVFAKTFLWPEKVCAGCVRQVDLFGWAVLAAVGIVIVAAAWLAIG